MKTKSTRNNSYSLYFLDLTKSEIAFVSRKTKIMLDNVIDKYLRYVED